MACSDKYVMVASIDFGTTFSGYAFSFKGSESDITINKNWGGSLGYQSYKAPTTVVTKGKKCQECVAFGYEAEEKFTEVDDDTGAVAAKAELNLFKHFKMVLHQKQKITTKTTISSTTGQIVPAIDIFTHALRFLKDHLLEELAKELNTPEDGNLIRWVITVPAIWSEESKKFMREAAFRSGCIKEQDSKQLIIALEPEAASFFCRQLKLARFAEGEVSFPSGTKYLVLDCGGGTNDMVVHEVILGYKVKEILAVNGGAWGGTKVDEAMVELLKEILGKHVIESFITKFSDEWCSFLIKWERAKKAFKNEETSKLNVELPFALTGWYSTQKPGNSIKAALTQPEGISYKRGTLILSKERVHSIFKETVEHIVTGVSEVLQNPEVEGINYIFMVGGFSESLILQNAIKQEFGGFNGCKVLVPHEAQLAIVKGAVLFGHHQHQIISRIARRTYGFSVNVEFDSAIHDMSKRLVTEDGIKCEDVFISFVNVNDNIEAASIREEMVYATGNQSVIQIFTSTRKPRELVQYVDDPNFNEVARISLSTPGATRGSKRHVKLKCMFGCTELFVEAIDVTSGNTVSTTIDFLSDK